MNNQEADDVVKPIFQAMIRNVPENLIKRIFFDVGNPSYFKYLPSNMKNDKVFIKDALGEGMIPLNQLSEDYRTSEFLDKKQYINLLKEEPELIASNIYPQDKDSVIIALGHSKSDILDLIEPVFRKDEEVLSEAVKSNPDLLYYIDPNIASRIRTSVEVMTKLIENDPLMFHELSEKQKADSTYLKLMLKSIPRYNEAKEFLCLNKDPDIALMALKLTKNAAEHLHSKFQAIIDKCQNKKDVYTLLKIQLVTEKNREPLANNTASKLSP